jgi:phage tail sheath protein FI
MAYLHGVEILQKAGAKPFRAGDTSVVAVVGVAEQGDNALTLITSLAEAQIKYGSDAPGTTIMSALKSLYADGTSPVLVVNVAEAGDQAGFMTTAQVGVNTINVVAQEPTGEFYTEIFEANLGQIPNAIPNIQTKILSGLELLLQAEAMYGYRPNFVICPGYSQVLTVGVKMRTIAATLKGKAIIDLYANSVMAALAERTQNYAYADERVILCSPNMLVYNEYAEADNTVALSQLLAAEIITGHAENGFWVSPSNRELKTVTGSVFPVVGSFTDSGAQNQLLNAKGIVTIFRTKGDGTRLWGNWTSAFPDSADLSGMIAASVVKDVIEETISRESLKFMDKNISYATLDAICQSVRSFFYSLKSRGALINADIWYEQSNNPLEQIAQGQFVFVYDFCPYPSLDRLTYESHQNLQYLNNLFSN